MSTGLQQAERFFEILAPEQEITFQLFKDNPSAKGYAKHLTSSFSQLTSTLIDANHDGMGVYWMVNEGDGEGRSKQNVVKIRALFLDLDGAPLESVYHAKAEPHAIIETSPGKYHVYWLVEDCPLSVFADVQTALAIKFGGDESINDTSRVMRVPGFFNHKPSLKEPFEIRFVESSESLPPYVFDELVELLELEGLVEQAQKKRNAPIDVDEFVKTRIEIGARHKTVLRYACRLSYRGLTAWERWPLLKFVSDKLCVSPLSDHDLKRINERAGEYAQEELAELESLDYSGLFGASTDLDFPSQLALSAPRLVGEITRWMLAGSARYQPSLALTASLSFVGALKGHRVKTETNLRTNLLLIGVAPSGAGKNHPIVCLHELAVAAGVEDLIGGEPTSGSGLITSLKDNNGVRLLIIDEIGYLLESLMSKYQTNHWLKQILSTIMKLFSCAGTEYIGMEFANLHDKHKTSRHDISQPCLGIFGVTTPDKFYRNIKSSFAIDGFLPRWLVLSTGEVPELRLERDSVDVPSDVLDEIIRIRDMPTHGETNGTFHSPWPLPKVVQYDANCRPLLSKLSKYFDEKAAEHRGKGSLMDAMWVRGWEHVQKLALTVCNDRSITKDDLSWSAAVVQHCFESVTAALAEKLADSEHEGDVKEILSFVRGFAEKGVTKTMLSRKFQKIRPRDQDEILKSLIRSDFIRKEIIGGKGRPITVYRATLL